MKKETKRYLVIGSVLAATVLFIGDSAYYTESVRRGLLLYSVNVLPTMLPFMFFSKVLTELDFASDLAPWTEKPMKILFRSPPAAGSIMLMSMLCGYPIGAKMLSESVKSGYIDREEAKRVMAYTSTSGPVFILGTVGTAMLGSATYGRIVLLSHYAATILTGIFFRGKKYIGNKPPSRTDRTDVLANSMSGTALSVGTVGGYIVLFNLVADMIFRIGIFSFVKTDWAKAFLYGLFEMTGGCQAVAAHPPTLSVPICSFLITFGGVGVAFQSMSYLSEAGIKTSRYLLIKGIQAVLAGILAFFAVKIFVSL